jgi:hypothetical protein
MDIIGNKVKVLDSFCDELVIDFKERVGRGTKYSGIYLYTSDGLMQTDLNEVRKMVVDKLGKPLSEDYHVIASICYPDKLQRYDARYPGQEGWFCVDIGWFIE